MSDLDRNVDLVVARAERGMVRVHIVCGAETIRLLLKPAVAASAIGRIAEELATGSAAKQPER